MNSKLFCLAVLPALLATGELASSLRAATVNVNIQGFAFSPQSPTINVGDTVVWTQNDNTVHTVTSTAAPFDLSSGNLSKGATYSHTFN